MGGPWVEGRTCKDYPCPQGFRMRRFADTRQYTGNCAQETCCAEHWYHIPWVVLLLATGCACMGGCCFTACGLAYRMRRGKWQGQAPHEDEMTEVWRGGEY